MCARVVERLSSDAIPTTVTSVHELEPRLLQDALGCHVVGVGARDDRNHLGYGQCQGHQRADGLGRVPASLTRWDDAIADLYLAALGRPVEPDATDDETTGGLDDLVVPPQHLAAGARRLVDLPAVKPTSDEHVACRGEVIRPVGEATALHDGLDRFPGDRSERQPG